MTKNKLNEMWWSGYCDETIKQAAQTSDNAEGRASRMRWARSHHNTCEQCKLANIMKALEYETAAAMGPDMTMLFHNGGDITKLPGFQSAFSATMLRAIEQGILTPKVYDWMSAQATRFGSDWPGLDSVQVAPAS